MSSEADTRLVALSLPLHHFDGPARVAIVDGLDIVEAPSPTEQAPATHMLRRTLRSPLGGGGGPPSPEDAARYAAAREDLWIAMRALHLVAGGACYGERIVDEGSTSQSGRRMLPDPPPARLSLSATDATRTSEVLRWCLDEPARRLLRIPLRRLHASLRRSRDDDRFIDLVVGLRAVLLPDYDTEMALRFAVRGSVLLGASLEERQQVFVRLRAAYRERDALRRTAPIDAPPASLDALTDDLRHCIRACAERMSVTREPLTAYITGLEAGLVR